MFYGKFAVEGDNPLNNANIYNVEGDNKLSSLSTTHVNREGVENLFFSVQFRNILCCVMQNKIFKFYTSSSFGIIK